MKDKKTAIAVLIALVVVIIAFYVRVTPQAQSTDNQIIDQTGSTTEQTLPAQGENPAGIPPLDTNAPIEAQ